MEATEETVPMKSEDDLIRRHLTDPRRGKPMPEVSKEETVPGYGEAEPMVTLCVCLRCGHSTHDGLGCSRKATIGHAGPFRDIAYYTEPAIRRDTEERLEARLTEHFEKERIDALKREDGFRDSHPQYPAWAASEAGAAQAFEEARDYAAALKATKEDTDA